MVEILNNKFEGAEVLVLIKLDDEDNNFRFWVKPKIELEKTLRDYFKDIVEVCFYEYEEDGHERAGDKAYEHGGDMYIIPVNRWTNIQDRGSYLLDAISEYRNFHDFVEEIVQEVIEEDKL